MGKGHAKNEDTLLAKGTANEISANTITHYFNTLFLNSALIMFRVASNASLTVQKMIDGLVDEFEDETGVDTSNSVNQTYDSTNDLYSPSGELDADTKALYHLNSAPPTDETTLTTMSLGASAEIYTSDAKFGAACLRLPNCNADSATMSGIGFSMFDGSLTLDFQFKSSSYVGDYRGLMSAVGGGIGWQLNLMGGTRFHLAAYCDNPPNWYQFYSSAFPFTLQPNTWYHLAISWDYSTKTVKYFVDGNYISSSDLTSHPPITSVINSMSFNNGNAPTGEHRYDEIRFSRAVRYTNTFTPPSEQYTGTIQNMTLLSEVMVAEEVPTEGRIILFEEDTDVITENTDLKAYISRDNGTTYTQVTLVDEGGYDSSRRILAGTVDISSQPSGTNMKYKITTHNNKNLKLHGVSLFWR